MTSVATDRFDLLLGPVRGVGGAHRTDPAPYVAAVVALLDLGTVLSGFLHAGLATDTDEHDDPLERTHQVADISVDSLTAATGRVDAFLREHAADLEGMDPDQAGHDLWMTATGHGTGFWDRGLGARGDRLTAAAARFGEPHLYVGDDGRVHLG